MHSFVHWQDSFFSSCDKSQNIVKLEEFKYMFWAFWLCCINWGKSRSFPSVRGATVSPSPASVVYWDIMVHAMCPHVPGCWWVSFPHYLEPEHISQVRQNHNQSETIPRRASAPWKYSLKAAANSSLLNPQPRFGHTCFPLLRIPLPIFQSKCNPW